MYMYICPCMYACIHGNEFADLVQRGWLVGPARVSLYARMRIYACCVHVCMHVYTEVYMHTCVPMPAL